METLRRSERLRAKATLTTCGTIKKKRVAAKNPRPNPFINFLKDFRSSCKGIPSKKVFKLAGKKWHQLSVEEKLRYKSVTLDLDRRTSNGGNTEGKDENLKSIVVCAPFKLNHARSVFRASIVTPLSSAGQRCAGFRPARSSYVAV